LNPTAIDETFTIHVEGPSYPGPTGIDLTFDLVDGVISGDNYQHLSNILPGEYCFSESDPGPEWTVTYSPISQCIIVTPGSMCGSITAMVVNTFDPGCLNVTKVVNLSALDENVRQNLADAQFKLNIQGPSLPAQTKHTRTIITSTRT
jgi:hypothetical protein